MTLEEDSLAYHGSDPPGKIEIRTIKPTNTQHDLSLAYSPGVAGLEPTFGGVNLRERMDVPEGDLADAMDGADVFVGLSAGGIVDPEMVRSMALNPIVFAMANPDPEIGYEETKSAREDTVIVATGRSDYPNQVNNVLGFPFIFRGALDVRAREIHEAMKVAAAEALAELARADVPDAVVEAYGDEPLQHGPEYIIPKPLDSRVLFEVAPAVARTAVESGVARRELDGERYVDHAAGVARRFDVERSAIRSCLPTRFRPVVPFSRCHVSIGRRPVNRSLVTVRPTVPGQ